MPTLLLPDRRIYYRVDGHGAWLVLAHGLSQNHMVWSEQLPALARDYRILRVDLRGHGFSSAPEGGYGQMEYLSDILAVLDHLGIRRAYWWGTHTGAGLGLLLATLQPDRVAALVLDGAVIPGALPPSVERHFAWARATGQREGVDALLNAWFEQGDWFAGMRAKPVERRALAHKDLVMSCSGAPWLSTTPPQPLPDIAALLPSVHQHTLLVNGSEDLPDFLATAAQLEQALPNATRYLIPGAGAFPFWEEPDTVNPVVVQWLGDR